MRDYFFLAIMWFNWYLVTLLVVLVQKTNKVISVYRPLTGWSHLGQFQCRQGVNVYLGKHSVLLDC